MPPDNLANATADLIEGLPNSEVALEPVQIELPPEEPATEPVAPAAPAAPVVQPKADDQKKRISERIAGLVGDKNALLQELDNERRRSAELTASLQQKDQDLSTAQTRQMELHKARLKTEAEQARTEYEQAYAQQAPLKLADATAKLARSESGLADVEAWEARNQAAKPAEPAAAAPAAPQQQQAKPQQPVRLDPVTASWMESNPWFQPQIDGRPNAEFDRGMHLTAVAYAARLEDKLRAEGRSNEIGNDEYWSQIDQQMSKEFPERYDIGEGEGQGAAVAAAAPGRVASSPVAPAVRSQPQNLTGKPNTNGKVLAQLSGQERGIADSLRTSGALLYPNDHPNTALRGKRMSRDDSYIAYGVQIRRDKAEQAQRRSNQ